MEVARPDMAKASAPAFPPGDPPEGLERPHRAWQDADAAGVRKGPRAARADVDTRMRTRQTRRDRAGPEAPRAQDLRDLRPDVAQSHQGRRRLGALRRDPAPPRQGAGEREETISGIQCLALGGKTAAQHDVELAAAQG